MFLRTTQVENQADIRAFFDRLAPVYRDCHGSAAKLLRYRLRIIERLLRGVEREVLVEIGCGTGLHLLALAASFRRAHGTDLAPAMIAQAEARRRTHACAERISFSVDPAETLASVADATASAVLCVGAFEHMPERLAVLRQVWRVLKPDGVFVCLTPHAGWLWYARLAPWLGYDITHLSSDRFVDAGELTRLLDAAGLGAASLDYWTFIPRGDIPGAWPLLLECLDLAGRVFRLPAWRGGLCCRAVKSSVPASWPGCRSDER